MKAWMCDVIFDEDRGKIPALSAVSGDRDFVLEWAVEQAAKVGLVVSERWYRTGAKDEIQIRLLPADNI